VGGGSVVLFIALFLPWFKVDTIIGSFSASGLTSHGYLYITLILSLAIIGLIAAEILGVWKLPATSPLGREQLLLVATAINFVLVLLAFLFKPGGRGVGWDFGAFVGLVAAVVAAFPLGWPVIQARRGK
jgi:quinol-cytochrome oxidoreductase complex cytochrome b subunit